MGTSTSAPEDRFCDIVMKGGIASGIVYPLAVAELAQKYRFRSIGGTSAGAVAAVVTAAAEYRRRRTGSMAGFEILKEVPAGLQKEVGKARDASSVSGVPPRTRTNGGSSTCSSRNPVPARDCSTFSFARSIANPP